MRNCVSSSNSILCQNYPLRNFLKPVSLYIKILTAATFAIKENIKEDFNTSKTEDLVVNLTMYCSHDMPVFKMLTDCVLFVKS